MTVEIVDRVEKIEPMVEAWNRLADRFGTPFHSFEWSHACAKASAGSGRLTIVVVRSQGEVIGIAPLIGVQRLAVPTLQFLGDPFCKLYEPNGLIYRDDAALGELLGAIVSLGMPVWLDRLPAETPMEGALKAGRRGRALLFRGKTSRSLHVPVAGDWQAVELGLSKSSRGNLRRGRKLAEGHGSVRFQTLSPGAEDIPACLQQFMQIEAAGWKGRAGTALVTNRYQREFISAYLTAEARRGMVRIYQMWIADELAAIRLAVEHSNRVWDLKIAYDEKFKQCSPGVLLAHETLRDAYERKLKGLEFNGEEEAWERIWTDQAHEHQNIRLYPLRPTGLAGFARDVSRTAYNRGREALARRQKTSG